MILAAGLGTRLKPLTNSKPKALVEVHGKPMLEWLILRLKKYSFDEIIINTYHFADQIKDFLAKKNKFDIRIEISRETKLLDTGGGIKKAAWFFDDDRSFLVHNVDVLTDIDYREVIASHEKENALATLVVRRKKTSRYFLFNSQNNLCGWQSTKSQERRIVRDEYENLIPLSFMGIHIIEPRIFQYVKDEGAFSIVDTYLQLGAKYDIKAFIGDNYRWNDLGRKENLDEVENEFSDILI